MSVTDHLATLLRAPLPAERPGRPADALLLERRAGIAGLSGPAEPVEQVIGGISCVVATVPQPRATWLHFHGGGYRHGAARDWAAFADRLAQATGSRVVLPDYRLAPEHPCPAALNDALAVAAALAADAPGPLLLSGDSAGGGLALAAASLMKRPLPFVGIALISPWLDLRLSAASFTRCAATDPIFSRESAAVSAEAYLQGLDCADPLASPLLGDLSGLPPVHLQVSASEVVVDDSTSLAGRLAAANVEAELFVVPDVIHDWPVVRPDEPQSKRALIRLARFLDGLHGNEAST